MLLAETIDAPDALLYPHGVPRHVVVDQGAAELEIQALGGGIRTQQNIGLSVAEPTFGIVSADPLPRAVAGGYFSTASREAHQLLIGTLQDFPAQKIHGVGVLGEDHRLAVTVLTQFGEDAFQASELAIRRQLADTGKKAFDVGLFFGGESLTLQHFHFIRIQDFIHGFIVRRIFVESIH